MAYTLTYTLNSDGNSYTLTGYELGAQPTGQLTIPDTYNSKPVTSIGEDAFLLCEGITSVIIGNNVTSIQSSAFWGCKGLTSVTIGNSVTSIGDNAFYDCSALTNINIPNSVTSIGESAFAHCDNLTSVIIPDSVTSIGEAAFEYCSSLTSVTIGNGVTSIGNFVFSGCISLASIEVDSLNTKFHSSDNCVIETATNTLVLGCKTSIIPTDGSVKSIGNYAFSHYDGLTSIDIPDSITTLGEGAFYFCTGLTNITIPEKVTSIGNSAFHGCSGLTSITIPDSVTSIGDYALAYCTSLTKINMLPTTPPTIQSNTFTSTTLQSIYVPAKCREDYITATNWNTNVDKITEFPILDLGSLLMYNNKVKEKIDKVKEKIDSVEKQKLDNSNPNLLINGNFAINQRGQKTYTGSGYTVDAWRGGQFISKVLVGDNGLTLSFSQAVTSGATAIQQKIDIDPLKLIGKTISISANISSVIGNYWYCRIRYADSAGKFIDQLSADILANGVVSATGVVPEKTASLTFQFTTKVGSVFTSDRITVEWAKVELGGVATTFVPPLISEELIKCKASESNDYYGASGETTPDGGFKAGDYQLLDANGKIPSERLDGVSCPNLSAGKLTDPFVIGSDAREPQTWRTKFATMTLKASWVSSSARFDIVDNNYANISTQPVGVEISASPTATDITLRAYVLYGNPEILKRIYISYSAVGTFPMTVDLYYVSGNSGYSSIGIKPLWQSHRSINSSLEFITTNTNVSELPTDRTNICVTDLTNYGPITRAYSATTLNSFVVKGRQPENVGWHKAMEIKAVNIGNTGGAGYSALILVNGVRGSTGESVTPAGSSIIEIDCRADNATNGVFLAGFLKVNILNGWLNKDNICAVLSEYNKTISVYINIEQQFMQYNLTKLSEGAEGVENVNALTFIDEYYGSSAPTGAIYAQIQNNASTTYATKADELSYFSVGTTATSNNNWYEIATVPLNVGNFDAFSIVLLLNGRKIGAQMSGIVELEGRSDAENGWTYKNFKVLCGNLASTHIAYWEDTNKTLHFYLWAPSTTYAISTISAQRGNRLNITNPLTLYQPSQLQQLQGLTYGANFNHAAYDSHSNYIPDTYARKAEVSKPNLLINPDFSINQRGQTSYSGYNIYTVDRWKTLAVAAKSTLKDGKWEFGIYNPDGPGSRTCICQDVEDFEKLRGRTVTASIKVNNITEGVKGTTVLYVYDGKNNMEVKITGAGTFTVVKVVNAEANKLRVGIAGTPSATNYTITPEWIKLEVGTEATPFTPPLIAEELPKCQRYYQRYNFATNKPLPLGIARDPQTVSINFNIPKLRDTATVKFSTDGTVKLLNQGLTGLALSLNQYYDGVCRMFITTSGLSAGTGILIAGDTDGYYALDAEIYEQS